MTGLRRRNAFDLAFHFGCAKESTERQRRRLAKKEPSY
jgi:hypothetical protein